MRRRVHLVLVAVSMSAGCPAWWEPLADGPGGPGCGDGELDPGEACDDGNALDHDRCAADCSRETAVVDMCAALAHTCVVLAGGALRCWGSGAQGRLGSGDEDVLGDMSSELPAADVEAGGAVLRVVCNDDFTCVLLDGGSVRCWGGNAFGQLGQGSTQPLGDEPGEVPTPAVPLSAPAGAIAAGHGHVCAIIEGDALQCWGWNLLGQLGYGHTDSLGDGEGELPAPPVDLEGVAEVVAGASHTCARTHAGTVHCWGSSSRGELGYEDTARRGDQPGELPTAAVELGGSAVQLAAGSHHTCARMAGGALRCWGANGAGQLGLGHDRDIGDEPGEMPPPAIDLGGAEVVQVVAGANHTCARHESGEVRCWGEGAKGQLGHGGAESIGTDPFTFPPPPVDLGGDAVMLAAHAGDSTCALLSDGTLRCWGANESGQLGYGFVHDGPPGPTTPADAGPVPF